MHESTQLVNSTHQLLVYYLCSRLQLYFRKLQTLGVLLHIQGIENSAHFKISTRTKSRIIKLDHVTKINAVLN